MKTESNTKKLMEVCCTRPGGHVRIFALRVGIDLRDAPEQKNAVGLHRVWRAMERLPP